MTDVQIVYDTEVTSELAEPILSHIVEANETGTAHSRILEARVNDTPITALCGHTWVPSRNPENHPVCQTCIEIFEFAKDLKS